MKTIRIEGKEGLPQAAGEFLQELGAVRVVAFYGKMGAGKTTFIAEVCRQLGVEEAVASPTFAIVNEYDSPEEGRICHFDFYRLKSSQEALDIGAEDYFYSGDLCFVEWPEKTPEIIPDDALKVQIEVEADGSRIFTLRGVL